MDDNLHPAKAGQSVIEFCIGLIALLTVVAGVFQIGLMGIGRTNARVDATAEAADRSMSTTTSAFETVHTYVREVTVGADERAYSMDDDQTSSGATDVYTRILEANQPSTLGVYAPDNDLAAIIGPTEMQAFTGLVRGSAVESGIPVIPIVRTLFFNQPSVDVEVEVWSIQTGGLY